MLASGLVVVHQTLAHFSKIPELELQGEEAEKLTKSTLDVMAHYNIVPTDKAMAWGALIATIAGVYGTRIFAYNIRKTNEAEEKRAAQKPNVHNFTPPGMMPAS